MVSIPQALTKFMKENKKLLTLPQMAAIFLGTAILSFGLHNIHQQADITEGGVLGMILLFNHWLGLTPAIVSPILDILCYAFAFRFLGKGFLKISFLSTICLAGFFTLWEQFPPVLPSPLIHPLVSSIVGGVFVGAGVGLVVRQGGSTGGDDALALVISKLTGCRISLAYLATDITVLLLSLTYIPFKHIGYSLVTVVVSSVLINYIQSFSLKKFTSVLSEAEFETEGS